MDIEYYKFTYQYQHYFPLSRTWTLAFNGEVYNDKPQAERAVTDIIYFASATAGE